MQVVNRVLDIVERLAKDRDGMLLKEIASALDLPYSTTHRLVTLLAERGYVMQEADSRRYVLGFKILKLHGSLMARLRVVDQATPAMSALRDRIGEFVHLGRRVGNEVVYLKSLEGTRLMGMYTPPIGHRAPAYCTSLGKAMLAYLPEAEIQRLLEACELEPLTSHTITSVEALRAELEVVRVRGYAVDDMEYEEGVRCLGAPIFNHANEVVAALSVAAPSVRLPPEEDDEKGTFVIEAARAISKCLGYTEDREMSGVD